MRCAHFRSLRRWRRRARRDERVSTGGRCVQMKGKVGGQGCKSLWKSPRLFGLLSSSPRAHTGQKAIPPRIGASDRPAPCQEGHSRSFSLSRRNKERGPRSLRVGFLLLLCGKRIAAKLWRLLMFHVPRAFPMTQADRSEPFITPRCLMAAD